MISDVKIYIFIRLKEIVYLIVLGGYFSWRGGSYSSWGFFRGYYLVLVVMEYICRIIDFISIVEYMCSF